MIRYGTFLKNSIYAMGYFWKVLFTLWGLSVLIYQKFFLRYGVLSKKFFLRYDILKFLLTPLVPLVQWIGYLLKKIFLQQNKQGWKVLFNLTKMQDFSIWTWISIILILWQFFAKGKIHHENEIFREII